MNRKQRRAAQKAAKRPVTQPGSGFVANQTIAASLLTTALAEMRKGNHAGAQEMLVQAVDHEPTNADAVHFLGMSYYYQGDPVTALPIVGRSLNLREDDPTFLSNFGVVAYATGKLELAIKSYQQSLVLDPKNADALTNLAAALNDKELYSQAKEIAEQAIALNPNGRGAYLNRGNALKSLDQVDEAIEDYKKSVELDPEYAHAHTMLGHAYDMLGKLELAEKHTRTAVELSPDMFEAHNNLATVLMRVGKKAQANIHLARSQDLNPNAKTLWNMALNLLDMGDFKQGISLYEFGFDAKTRLPARRPPMPRWRGEDLAGKSIMIWREQGVGDELRFAEWYHHVISLGARCIIEAKPKLVPLFERSFPDATILPEDFTRDVGRCDADFQMPAGDLPAFFGLRPNPEKHYAYLQPDPFRAKGWHDRIADLGEGTKIGICWRSGMRNARRNFAYAELEDLMPLFELQNTQFVSLQYDDCRKELAEFEEKTGVHIHNFDDVDQFDDLDETAAMTAGLDLVVTAGTAVAQMAGALGIETWRFEARGSRLAQPPVAHPWLQPNGVLWYGHWQESWRDVMERMAVALGERLASDPLEAARAG